MPRRHHDTRTHDVTGIWSKYLVNLCDLVPSWHLNTFRHGLNFQTEVAIKRLRNVQKIGRDLPKNRLQIVAEIGKKRKKAEKNTSSPSMVAGRDKCLSVSRSPSLVICQGLYKRWIIGRR